jgi:hypothetical protein
MRGWLLGVINWIGDFVVGGPNEFVNLPLISPFAVRDIDNWIVANVPWITDVSKYPRLADWISTHISDVVFHPFGIFRD